MSPQAVFLIATLLTFSKAIRIAFSSLKAPDQFRYIQQILRTFKIRALNLVSIDFVFFHYLDTAILRKPRIPAKYVVSYLSNEFASGPHLVCGPGFARTKVAVFP
jgi:hypothetical protein